ncbi:hypothetical protein [Nocardioides jishulii]|uniref:Uncharacterized protein n=1 Tax=Nocardioides jishulii TaxID=2575440 RepID=A0A4U2YJT8_9ACTN|nr:hypothetical protein [Nocardioides jishulii]QCX26954.1 hypothetical protein FCL41_04975 [Nocardioides jishulii]TKI61437.1 hypothetical protein FC770_11610 [Nocardioides jishulii]
MMADAANWVSALASLLALGAATWAGVTAKRLYEIERGRETDRVEAQERSQADQFASWISWSSQPQVAMPLADGLRSPSLALQNGAPVPVYDVVIKYFEGPQVLGEQTFSVISPTGSIAHYRQIECPGLGDVLLRPRERGARLDLRVALTFTDAHGIRWTRDRTGRLQKSGLVPTRQQL